VPRTLVVLTAVLLAALTGCQPDPAEPDPPPGPAEDPPAKEFRLREFPLPGTGGYGYGHIDVVAFSPNGKLVATSGDSALYVWDATTGEMVTRMHLVGEQYTVHVAFAADGKTLMFAGSRDPFVRSFDLKTGKQVREWAHPKPSRPGTEYLAPFVAFVPGAEWMIATDPDNWRAVRVVDTATGKVGIDFKEAEPGPWTGQALSPDGKLFAAGSSRGVARVWDTATGKLVQTIGNPAAPHGRGYRVHAFSPDGKFLAVSEEGPPGDPQFRHYMCVWGVADGKRYCALPGMGFFSAAAFSADGRTLATCGTGGKFYLLDLLADVALPGFQLPTRACYHIASPDGKTLALLGGTGVVGGRSVLYLTPFPKLAPLLPDRDGLTPQQLDEWWAALSSENEFRRRYAVRAFVARPDDAVSAAAARVKSEPQIGRARVADLIETLDADDPNIRDKAQAELDTHAHRFEPLAVATLKGAPAGEVRNRLTSVLAKVKRSPSPPGLVADLRTVELLEELETPAAKKLLTELAAGAAGSRLTDEAAAAIKRLNGKK